MPASFDTSPAALAPAVARLQLGGLVAFPTETVYGLGADATDPAAVARVFAAKGRPSTNPLIVHVADESMARSVVTDWPALAARAAAAFWPGPLTLVLPAAPHIPRSVTAGGDTVGVRCPDHPLTLALIRAFAKPIVGPSANRSGGVSPTRVEHVREAFPPDQVLALDGGPCREGLESTVLDLTTTPPRVLRPGVIGAEQLARVLGVGVEEGLDEPTGDKSGGPLRSPGLLTSHYAPAARAVTYRDSAELTRLVESAPGPVIAMTPDEASADPRVVHWKMPRAIRAYAAAFYDALRSADARQPDLIAIHWPLPPSETADKDTVETEAAIVKALQDRILRATAPVFVDSPWKNS